MKEYIIKIGDEPDIMGNYGLKEKPKELVRCEDCKYRECVGRFGDIVCDRDGTPHRPEWFCPCGERMTSE